MTFSEFYVGIVVKLKGIKIWVLPTPGVVLSTERPALRWVCGQLHTMPLSLSVARPGQQAGLRTQHVLCLRPGKPSW